MNIILSYLFIYKKIILLLKMGIGDWAQSPIPNPHEINFLCENKFINKVSKIY